MAAAIATIRAQTAAPMPKVKMPSAAQIASPMPMPTPRPTTEPTAPPTTESVPANALSSQCRMGVVCPSSLKLGKACAKPEPGAARSRTSSIRLVAPGTVIGRSGGATRVDPPILQVQSPSEKGWKPNGFRPVQTAMPVIVMVRGVCSFKRLNQSTALPMKKPRTAPVAAPRRAITAPIPAPAPESRARSTPSAAPAPAPAAIEARIRFIEAALSPPTLFAEHPAMAAGS